MRNLKLRAGAYRFVILSRARSKTIGRDTLRFFPSATVFVHHDEVEDYAKVVPRSQIATHGDVTSFGDLCCQALDSFDEELLMLMDDYLQSVRSYTTRQDRLFGKPEMIEAMCLNAAECAYRAGAKLFSFPNGLPFHSDPLDPISFRTRYLPGFQGIIGRSLRHDPKLLYHTDADLCLQALKKDHLVYVDRRMMLLFLFNENPGGNNMLRMRDNQQANHRYLLEKWGEYARTFFQSDEQIIKRRNRRLKGRGLL